MANLNINPTSISITKTIQNNVQASNSSVTGQGQNVDFRTLLTKQLQEKSSPQVNFSKHAQQRVTDRQIDVSTSALIKLNDAIGMAKSKGVKDALILNGDTMFIVNTPSNTVITALKGNEIRENVFTNIDGTVIM